MTEQIKPSVTNPTIADIFEKIDNGRLDLSPDFQRKFVWTQEHQEQFLDTIIKGYPFPEIYVCKGETDTQALITRQKVIDGQQRLTTIRNYIENTFNDPLKLVPEFESLSADAREQFLSYQVVVRDIGNVNDGLVREIFRRINLTKFKLEDIEIHNAIYDGKFIQAAKYLAKDIDLKSFGVFHDSEFTRMADVYFFLQIMATIETGGYFTRDTEVEKCIEKYNDKYENERKTVALVQECFQKVVNLNLALDSIWFRKSNFFTLVVEFCFAKNIPADIKKRLLNFEGKIMGNRNNKDNDFGVYYGCMYAGTTSRKSRVTRSKFFKKYVLSNE